MSTSSKKLSCQTAFTLVEMLAVLAIIGILTALALPALNGIGKAYSLSTAGSKVSGMVEQARQNSMSKNVMTALVLMTNQGTDSDYRAMILLEKDPRSSTPAWRPITKWENLPVGVTVDSSATDSTFLTNGGSTTGVLTSPLPVTAKFRGATVSNFAARIFMSNGGLKNPSEATKIKLVEGSYTGGVTKYTHPAAGGGSAANYYNISIVGVTGRSKIDRPTQ
jgi:prepilin-type N-terminal cleavage/methylation domain-containing protein